MLPISRKTIRKGDNLLCLDIDQKVQEEAITIGFRIISEYQSVIYFNLTLMNCKSRIYSNEVQKRLLLYFNTIEIFNITNSS